MNKNEPIKRKATKKDVAFYLQCTTRTVDNLMAKGMPYVKVGRLARFELSEVDGWLKGQVA